MVNYFSVSFPNLSIQIRNPNKKLNSRIETTDLFYLHIGVACGST